MVSPENRQEVEAICRQITALEKKILNNKIEYRDREANWEKYQRKVRDAVAAEGDAVYIEIQHVREDNADVELFIKSIRRQMDSVRMFEGTKMTELDRELARMEHEHEANLAKIEELDLKHQEITESLEERLDELDGIKANLLLLIESDEQKLARKKMKLEELISK